MSLFGFFRPTQKKSAETAKERLQILLAHERSNRTGPDYLPLMQKEIIAVIMKYVEIDEEIPEPKKGKRSAAAAPA